MSNRLIDACKPLRMPPTAKAVLICLADYADDTGRCWPSIDRITEFTCFGRTAVIEAIKWLEGAGAVVADRTNGRHTEYRVTPETFAPDQSVSRTRPAPGPVRQAVRTSPAPGRDQSGSRTAPVRQADSNHQEPPRTPSKATPKKKAPASAVARPEGVQEQVWNDWLTLRKAKKAPVTETVLRQATAEAAKAGLPLNRFLEIWCARGSQGLEASWLKPHERAAPSRPSAADSFHGKTYTGTAIDELPESLRPAA